MKSQRCLTNILRTIIIAECPVNIRKETKLCEHANGSRLWKDSTDTDSREITEHAHKRNARI